jgi:hypothetical protein
MSRVIVPILLVVTACSGPPVSGFEVSGIALAGPVCPVESLPPDPACAPRPVVGATVEAVDQAGTSLGSAVTDNEGRFTLTLPAGEYTIVAMPVDGLMGTPVPLDITVAGSLDVGVLAYDTGIR